MTEMAPGGAIDLIVGTAVADHVDCVVVVVTYNSASDITGLLRSVPAAAGDLRYRCIVVDNGSSDGTVDAVAAEPGVRCIATGANLGYAGGVNVGYRYAGPCSSVLIVNPDLRLEPGSIARLFAALSDPTVGMAVPMMFDGNGVLFPSLRREPSPTRALGDALFGRHFPRRPAWLSEMVRDEAAYRFPQSTDWSGGAALLISASCGSAIGAWDEDFFLYSEETDAAARARDAGFRICYVPDARVHHRGEGSGRSSELVALMVVNRIRYFEKRHRRPATSIFRLAVVLHELLRVSDPTHWQALRAALLRSRWSRLPSRHGEVR